MKKHEWISLNILLTAVFVGVTAFGIDNAPRECETGEGNIYNATVIIHDSIRSETDGRYRGETDTGCFGESGDGIPFGESLAFAIHGDDPITTRKDGLLDGESFGITGLIFENDAVYIVKATAQDTTLSAAADSLSSIIGTLATVLDSTRTANAVEIGQLLSANNDLSNQLIAETARADALQTIVDNAPDVTALNARIVQLESDVNNGANLFWLAVDTIRDLIAAQRQ